ncbi:claudin 10-like 2 isoform X2 [Neoarius graeffei]|uniref:claudin 10-like 2 isoform X2 n=1 Tax=Neoarius graeffei TaxID=443677 RepID=UPI00298D209E|nr:claudin 10-like 2 isoform X2 [Neoarius graeffei]
MKKMLIQVFGFLISTVGWFLVCCTVGMDYWRVTYIGGQGGSWIIKAAWYWSTLWRDCYIDSSGVSSCKDYDTMWDVNPTSRTEQGSIQAVRALLLVGMFLGLFATIFCFFGMDCTYIGGQEKTKYKILLLGTVHHFAGGRLGTVAFTRMADARLLRYYIGTPVLFGLIGSSCIILSSVLYAVTFYSVLTGNREMDISASRKYIAPKTHKTYKKKGQTFYIRDDARSIQSRSFIQSSSQVSRSSIIQADRDTFV